jgi:hypothetical protein
VSTQVRLVTDKYPGEILFRIGVPHGKINQALYYYHKRKSIGEILIDQKLISSGQLEEALSKQKEIKEQLGHKRPPGLLLIERGHIQHSRVSNGPVEALQHAHSDPEGLQAFFPSSERHWFALL